MQRQERTRGRIRALRKDDVRVQLERRLAWLGIGPEWRSAETDAQLARRLNRALRRERRAAGGRLGSGYDPLRHLVLLRLARMMRRRPGKRELSAIICGGPAACPDPSAPLRPGRPRRVRRNVGTAT